MAFIRGNTDGSNGPKNENFFAINQLPFSDPVIRGSREDVCAVLGPTQRAHQAIMSFDFDEQLAVL